MNRLERVLLKVLGNVPTSEFNNACLKVGLNDEEIDLIVEAIIQEGE